ncbi:hypothetical protein ACPESL_01175 [Psychrobacter pocilloporae]|uniref:hypothetical protein n=1 Tax=Psychrobacter TaxID=497 RepID=UPI003C2E2001
MAINDNLPDSQHFLKISTDGGDTFTKVPLLTNIDMPERKKTFDDITPTDARNTHKAVVDFIETNDPAFELVYDPANAQHIALKTAFDNDDVVQCEIHFVNIAVNGFKFDGQIGEWTPVPDVKKKLRIKGNIVIGGDVTEITSAP